MAPPSVQNLYPADTAQDVPVYVHVSFEIVADTEAVDGSTISVSLNGQDVVVLGVPQSGYQVILTPNGMDYHVEFYGDFPLNSDTVYTLSIDAEDVLGAAMTTFESAFTTWLVPDDLFDGDPVSKWPLSSLPDGVGPYIIDYFPTGVGVPRVVTVGLTAADEDSGVNIDSVVIVVAGVVAYEANTQQNGFVVTVTGGAPAYSFEIIPPEPFDFLQTVLVEVYVEDF